MTPKEKAKELISKFTFLSYPESNSKFYNPKQCAIIAVDEMLNFQEMFFGQDKSCTMYIEEVKTELEKL